MDTPKPSPLPRLIAGGRDGSLTYEEIRDELRERSNRQMQAFFKHLCTELEKED